MHLVGSGVKESAVPARLAGKILYCSAQYLWVLSVDLALFHLHGA